MCKELVSSPLRDDVKVKLKALQIWTQEQLQISNSLEK
jgi:hypothetical protein